MVEKDCLASDSGYILQLRKVNDLCICKMSNLDLITLVFLPEEFYGQKSLMDYRQRGCKESNMTEALSTICFLGVSTVKFLICLLYKILSRYSFFTGTQGTDELCISVGHKLGTESTILKLQLTVPMIECRETSSFPWWKRTAWLQIQAIFYS